jgi:hypothetical protein
MKSACGELAPFIAYVEKHMADDGVFMPARYVGFGFQLDSNPEDEMRVVLVTPDTPGVGDSRHTCIEGPPARRCVRLSKWCAVHL